MNLAISNIAWPLDEEGRVATALHDLGVEFVEIAPTKVFDQPTKTNSRERNDYRQFWADHGISIVAFQSMLFGRPDLQVFGDPAVRGETLHVLSRFIELAGALGVGKLVFGSPKNRVVPPGMEIALADQLAVDFFTSLGEIAVDNGTCFCIEPNPIAYDCNFVTRAAAGIALVEAVNHPGFGLHLDTAGMSMAGDDLAMSILAGGSHLRHFHASAPFLGALEEETVDHDAAASALENIGYQGFVSIEMRPGDSGMSTRRVRSAVELARRHYSTLSA